MEIDTRIAKVGGTYFIKVPFLFAKEMELEKYVAIGKDSDKVRIDCTADTITIKLKRIKESKKI